MQLARRAAFSLVLQATQETIGANARAVRDQSQPGWRTLPRAGARTAAAAVIGRGNPRGPSKTSDVYRTLRANLTARNLGKPGSQRYRRAVEKPIVFRPEGAQPYDDWMLFWQYTERTVSICTLSGLMKEVAFTAAPEHLARLALYRMGESDLLYRDGMWFLIATCEVPEAELNLGVREFLAIDLGIDLRIVNIATTSDGQMMAGRRLNRGRLRERTLPQILQKKNTPSAKRRLKKRRHKEARRVKNINHKIAKHVVAEAERTERGIALEDLTGIRARVRLRKS